MNNHINISLTKAGKKFAKEWIFRKLSIDIKAGDKLVVLGLNGSGKSTFLQTITGFITLNEGAIEFKQNNTIIPVEQFHHYISLASPYLELLEDFSLKELVEHTATFKPFINQLTTQQIIDLSGLAAHQHKPIKLFSSGMKQRLKLTLAILADTEILFLDEPTTNLDATVIAWYQQLIATYASHKTIIVCSNSVKEEYSFCTKTLIMDDFKI